MSKNLLNDEVRNLEITNDAYKLAHKRILEGTATSQEIVFFLRFGAEMEKTALELEKIRAETELAKAKVAAIHAGEMISEDYAEALAAFRGYQGESNG